MVLFGTDTVTGLNGTAQMQHSQHGKNHHHALQEQGHLKLLPYPTGQTSIINKMIITSNISCHTYSNEWHFLLFYSHMLSSTPSTLTAAAALNRHSPEENAQYVGNKQHQTDPRGETLCVIGSLDLLVLGDVGHSASEHHHAGGQPGEQSPRALHVLLWRLLHRSVLTNTLSLYSHPLCDPTPVQHTWSQNLPKKCTKHVLCLTLNTSNAQNEATVNYTIYMIHVNLSRHETNKGNGHKSHE